MTKHVRNVDFAAEQHQNGTCLGQDRQCVYGWVGTKHGWCSPKTGLVPSVPALPGQALHHPRVSQSFPAPASPQDKEAEVLAEDKDVRVGLTVGGRGLLFGHFWPQLWRAFLQERICSCCCSPPLLPGSWSHSKSKASLKSAHKSCSRVTMCPQTVRPERPGCRTGKQWSGEKGNLLARWPCVFNWLLGKAEKVMCTNQSRITDQSQSELTRPRPIRNRVLLPSSAPPGLDRGSGQRALFTKTKWTTGLVADGGQDDNVPHPEVQPGEAPHELQTPSAARSWPC